VRRILLAGFGGVIAAFLGALCCIGPLMFVAFGVGAGLAATFEPLRPIFGILMITAFVLAFRSVYGGKAGAEQTDAAGCNPDGSCQVVRRRMREEVILWSAVVIALAVWTFPTWSVWFL